jgi:hypothetical protein
MITYLRDRQLSILLWTALAGTAALAWLVWMG